MRKSSIKDVFFMAVIGIYIIGTFNFVSGLIVQDTALTVDPIDKRISTQIPGYFYPNLTKKILSPGLKPYTVSIDNLGFRRTSPANHTPDELDSKYKILSLGDSILFGFFVEDKDSFPYRLQNLLNQGQKEAVVFNAAAGGATIHDYVYYLKKKGLALKPDLVVVNFCPNDLKELSRQDPLYETIQEENSWGRKIKLANLKLIYKFYLDYKLKRTLKKIVDAQVRQAYSSESKDLDDVLRVAAYHGERWVMNPRDNELKEQWRNYFAHLSELIDLLRQKNIDFVYVIFPDIITVFDKAKDNYQDILTDFLKKNQVAYIDLLPYFKEHKAEFLSLYNNPPRDFHLSPYSNELLAEELYRRIADKIPSTGSQDNQFVKRK